MFWIGVGAVCVVLLLVVNKQAVARFFSALRAQFGKAGRAVEEADTLALLNQAVDDGVTSIQNAKKGLENARSLVLSVKRQVEQGEKEKDRLESRIKAAMDAGDPNHTATDYALQLAGIEEGLTANKEQLERHTKSYENFAQQVQLAQKKVVVARQKAASLGVQLEMSEREKEMAQFANDFSFDPNKLNSGMARAEELLQRKIDKNRAAGDVAMDMSQQALAEAKDEELERQAAAAKILERFKK